MTGAPYFVIFGAMRTGSNLLEKTLEALGDTVCYGEPFNPAFVGGPRREEVLGWDLAQRNADPMGFLAALRDSAGDRIPGFRLFDGHDGTVMKHALADPECRRIVLTRDPVDSYVSLKIARQTDQWLLRRKNKRVNVRITFDPAEFDAYQDRLKAHYFRVDQEMERAGTSALRVTYEDLSDPGVLQAVASFVGSTGTPPAEAPILRQNPGHLSEKVANYEEMCVHLDRVPEPGPLPRRTGAGEVLLAERAPFAYAPISGPGFAAAVSLIYRIEQRAFDGPSLSYAQLMERSSSGDFLKRGFSLEALAAEAASRKVFTVICHPVARLHALFLQETFGPAWHASPIRRRLQGFVGGLPSPRELTRAEKRLEPERHLAAFFAYIRLIEDAYRGTADFPVTPDWQTQSEQLDAYRDDVDIEMVSGLDDLTGLATWLAEGLAGAQLPGNHIAAVRERALSGVLPLEEVRIQEVSDRIGRLFSRDFNDFGYQPWPEANS